MHTVYPVGGASIHKWVVQYVGPEKATNLCWFKHFAHACVFASFLNGGQYPEDEVWGSREMA